MAIQVQCILYTSLAASLLSAFLAMLGKQWLNRYASIDKRGPAIERSQNRQRKLDGIVTWYFNHVLESLPLLLQGALLLLGCALSRYLWEIDTTVAFVVLGVTSFGALLYLFVVVAGAVSDSCPYQTPGANIIRHVSGLLRSAYRLFVGHSTIYHVLVIWWGDTTDGIIIKTLSYPLMLLTAPAIDTFHLGRETFRMLVDFARRVRSWLFDTTPATNKVFNKSDIRCIFWMLQTSLDKTINVLALNFLGATLSLTGLNSSTASAVTVGCFDLFSSCFATSDGVATMVTHGSEKVAEMSAMFFFIALSHLSSMEPTSTITRDVRQRYKRIFPSHGAFQGLPCPVVMNTIYNLLCQDWQKQLNIHWSGYNPSIDELVPFSRALAQAAQFEHRTGGDKPRFSNWLADFPLRFLCQDTLPPTSVVIDCLIIVGTGLGFNVSDNNVAPDERCVYTSMTIVSLLIQHQQAA